MMENFGKFMTIILAMIISPIISGFVIMKLWLWFIVPIFEINPLRIVEAIGLMFFVNYLKIKRYEEEDRDRFWEKFKANVLYTILMAGFALFTGWLVNLFM